MSTREELFHSYTKMYRDIEKMEKKCVTLNGSVIFNKTCLNNGI